MYMLYQNALSIFSKLFNFRFEFIVFIVFVVGVSVLNLFLELSFPYLRSIKSNWDSW